MQNKLEEVSEACASCAARHQSDEPATLGRRQFISASLMAAAAAALAACAGATDSTSPGGTVSLSVKVSDYASLSSVGGVALVSASGSPVAIVRTGTTTFIALSRVCPHQGTTVNQTSNGFLCPNHGATFNQTGTWVGGQKTSNMRSYATSYDAVTGTLTIG